MPCTKRPVERSRQGMADRIGAARSAQGPPQPGPVRSAPATNNGTPSVALEMVEGLLARTALVQRLARGGAEVAHHFRVLAAALGACNGRQLAFQGADVR